MPCIVVVATSCIIVIWWTLLVGFKPYLQDQLVSFSALTLLVLSYDL